MGQLDFAEMTTQTQEKHSSTPPRLSLFSFPRQSPLDLSTETGEKQSLTPPRLSLFSFQRQSPEPPLGTVTPPLHASISVPFQWEEAPGKPRPVGITKPRIVRSLDLPPRLFADGKLDNFASPTVAGGDLSFRLPVSWAETREGKDCKYVGSRRWMSFRKNKENSKRGTEISLSGAGADGGAGDTTVKITRFRSRRSFFGKSSSKPHLIASIYGSLKQVIPWRCKHDEMKKVSH